MNRYAVLTNTSLETAVTSTAAAIASALDASKQPGAVLYELASSTAAWIAQGIPDTVFTALASTDVCTAVAHGLATGWAVQVSNSGGALPTGLSAATTYWAIVLSVDTFKLATSRANALAGTAIDITTNGTGTQTATTVATKAAGSHFIPAGYPVLVDGSNGARLSIIRDAADGLASVALVQVGR